MPDEVHVRTTAHRRVIARPFAQLDDDQLDTASLCAGWTCRDVLGHLRVPALRQRVLAQQP